MYSSLVHVYNYSGILRYRLPDVLRLFKSIVLAEKVSSMN